MIERLNIISIFCNVFLDVSEHSKKTDTEQIVLRNHIDGLFNIAYEYIGQTNHIILVTDTGATIAYEGPPESAMLMARDMLNEILVANKQGSISLSVCIGIHLQPVREVNDFNEQSNIIGSGINAAKRMVSRANPNEILVSRSYYENIPPSTQAISTLFNDQNDKYENHVLDYQAYLAELNLHKVPENQSSVLNESFTSHSQPAPEKTRFLKANSWKYALASLFIVVALFSIVELGLTPAEAPSKKVKTLPLEAFQSSNLKTSSAKPKIIPEIPEIPEIKPEIPLQNANPDGKDNVSEQEKVEPTDPAKPKLAKKAVKQQTKNRVDSTSEKSKTKEIISWESLKSSIRQGKKHDCTQSEIALNQCL